MPCEEVLRRCNTALDRCLREVRMSDSGAFAAAMAQACDHIGEAGGAVACLATTSSGLCREQCVDERRCDEVREGYRSRLLELQSMLPLAEAVLKRERDRLAGELTFVRAARSWAEFSQPLTARSELRRVE